MRSSSLDRIPSSEWIDLARKAKFKAAELARLCYVSARRLERYFDAVFCMSPARWLREMRLRAACQLIMQGVLEKQIAAELGFSNLPHFIRDFRACYGCTPRQYAAIEAGRSEGRTA